MEEKGDGFMVFVFFILTTLLMIHGLNNNFPIVKIRDAELKCANNGGLYDIEVGFFYDEVMCKNYATFKLPHITEYQKEK